MKRYRVIEETVYRIFDTEKDEVMEEVPGTYLYTCPDDAVKACEELNLFYNSAVQMVKDNYSWTRLPRNRKDKG